MATKRRMTGQMKLFTKKILEEEPILKVARGILSDAVNMGATKIVFGVPVEADCTVVPFSASPASKALMQLESEEISRFAEETGLAKRDNSLHLSQIPCWMKIGTNHEEIRHIPACIYLDFLFALRGLHDPRLRSHEDESKTTIFSTFQMTLDDGLTVQASLMMETNHHFSIAIAPGKNTRGTGS